METTSFSRGVKTAWNAESSCPTALVRKVKRGLSGKLIKNTPAFHKFWQETNLRISDLIITKQLRTKQISLHLLLPAGISSWYLSDGNSAKLHHITALIFPLLFARHINHLKWWIFQRFRFTIATSKKKSLTVIKISTRGRCANVNKSLALWILNPSKQSYKMHQIWIFYFLYSIVIV